MKEKKINEKFPKSTLLPDWGRCRHQSAFVDGHSYTNPYGTMSFPSEGRGNFLLTVNGVISTIF